MILLADMVLHPSMRGDVGFSRVKRKHCVLRLSNAIIMFVYAILWRMLCALAEILIPFLVARINCYTSTLIG